VDAEGAEGMQDVRNGLVGVVRGDNVSVTRSAVGVSTSKATADVKQGVAGTVFAGGDATLAQGYATAITAAGDATVRQSGVQWLLSAGDVDIELGGALAVAAPRVTVRRGFVGLVAARQAQIEDGSRVLLNATGAAAFGAALGAALAIVGAIAFGTRLRKR